MFCSWKEITHGEGLARGWNSGISLRPSLLTCADWDLGSVPFPGSRFLISILQKPHQISWLSILSCMSLHPLALLLGTWADTTPTPPPCFCLGSILEKIGGGGGGQGGTSLCYIPTESIVHTCFYLIVPTCFYLIVHTCFI